jgi:hypothetical protein
MKSKVGLWIDHKKAIIVTLMEKGEEIKEIDSNVEKQLRRTGDSPLKGPFEKLQIPSDTRQHRMYTGQLKVFYTDLANHLREAESILIFGPGEAKNELKEVLEESHLGKAISRIETEDKMTKPQIVVKVRQFFMA